MSQAKLSCEQQEFLTWVDETFRGQCMGTVMRRSGKRDDYDAWQETILLVARKLLKGEWSVHEPEGKVAKFVTTAYSWNAWHDVQQMNRFESIHGKNGEWDIPIYSKEDTSTHLGDHSSLMHSSFLSELSVMPENGIKIAMQIFVDLYLDRPFEPGTRRPDFMVDLLDRYCSQTGRKVKSTNTIRVKMHKARERLWAAMRAKGVVSGKRIVLNSMGVSK